MDLLNQFLTGEDCFLSVDDDNVVTTVNVWSKGWFMFAAEQVSSFGSGAAGGMGFALRTFLDAQLVPGIRLVMEEMGAEQLFAQSDLVITGEGRLDGQTMMGKVPMGVATLAKKYHKPVVALAGSLSPEAIACNEQGIDAFFPILREIVTLEQAMQKERAMENLMLTAEQVFRLWRL